MILTMSIPVIQLSLISQLTQRFLQHPQRVIYIPSIWIDLFVPTRSVRFCHAEGLVYTKQTPTTTTTIRWILTTLAPM